MPAHVISWLLTMFPDTPVMIVLIMGYWQVLHSPGGGRDGCKFLTWLNKTPEFIRTATHYPFLGFSAK